MPPRGGEQSRGPRGLEVETPKVLAEQLGRELSDVDFYYGDTGEDEGDLAEELRNQEIINGVGKLSDIDGFSEQELTDWIKAAHEFGMIEAVDAAEVDENKLKMKDKTDRRSVFRVNGTSFLTLPRKDFEAENSLDDAKRMLKNQMALHRVQHRLRILQSGIPEIEQGTKKISEVINGQDVPDTLKDQLKRKLEPGRSRYQRDQRQGNQLTHHFDNDKKVPIDEEGQKRKQEIIDILSGFQTPQEEAQIRELAGDFRKIETYEAVAKRKQEAETLEEQLKAEQKEIEKKETEELQSKTLADQVKTIRELEHPDWGKYRTKTEILGMISGIVNLEGDPSQPGAKKLQKRLAVLKGNTDSPKVDLEAYRNLAIDVLIRKEVASREVPDGYTFDEVNSVLQCEIVDDANNLSVYLKDDELRNYYRDVYIEHPELFSGEQLTEEQEQEKQELMARYTLQAKRNVVERMSDVQLDPQMPYGEIQNFLMSKDPSVYEIVSFLTGKDVYLLGTELYSNGMIEHFNAEGQPIDDLGENLRDAYLKMARERAENNEYQAIAENVDKEYSKEEGIGNTVDEVCKGYIHTINELGGTVVRNEEGKIVKVKHNRHWREKWTQKGDVSKIAETGDLLKELEGFSHNYKRELGRYLAETRDFQRVVQERLDELGEGQDFGPKERARIRKRALQLRLDGLHVNRLVRDELTAMTATESEETKPKHPELLKTMGGNAAEFLNQKVQDETGWERPVKLDTPEQRGKYDAIMADEKRKFVEVMMTQMEGQTGEYGAYQTIADVAVNGDPAEIRRLINQFNNENSAGLLEFAAEVSFMEKILRKDLTDAVQTNEVTKIIDLLTAQDMHDTLKIDRLRKFDQVAKRFASKEKWRQRYEGVLRTISGNPDAKLDKWEQISEFFEQGKGPASITYKGGVWTKTTLLNTFNRTARAGLATRTLYNSTVDFFLPSERTRKKIDRDVGRRSVLFSNRIERNERLKRLRRFRNSDWLFSIENRDQMERITARAKA